MSDHNSFEELCALAATGDLSAEEFGRLQQHLHDCPDCRQAYRDFHNLVHSGLPAMAPPPRRMWRTGRTGLKRRFLERARKEGIEIETIGGWSGWRWKLLAPAAAAAALFLSAWVGYAWRGYRPAIAVQVRTEPPHDAGELALLTRRVADLEKQLATAHVSVPSPPPEPPRVNRERELADELARMRSDYQNAAADKARLEQTVAMLSNDLKQAGTDMQAARAETESLQRHFRETQAALARANQQLDPLRAAQAADAQTIAAQRAQLAVLTAQVREQTETLQRERDLLAAGKDIRDLMGARNLRVVDVQDTGAAGRKRAIPGRIFYTQGKSLIFYAYDLQNKGNINKVAFQVWGKKEGRSHAPRSLGIMYVDDSAQKRWAMKFENPDVLAQIDEVFVTVEPAGGSHQPTGKPFLAAAFLNDDPNHP